jgi:hypothetical protein
MNAIESFTPTNIEPSGWADICDRHPDQWVCLVDLEHQLDGRILAGRVVGHDRSLTVALQQVDTWSPDCVVAYAHTGGRKLRRLLGSR